jgi:hypothetical protein
MSFDDEALVNPETHHERSDVNVRALLWFMAAFIVFAAISHVLLFVMFKYFAERARNQTTTPLTMLARPADASIPTGPRLQPFPNVDQRGSPMPPNTTTPPTDMVILRRMEEQALRSPGWIDRQKGIVRVPIDVAKQLVVQRGLPVVNQ